MYSDLETIKAQHDLRSIAASELGKSRVSTARYDVYRCPFHNEHHGYSLQVWADGFKCYGAKCGVTGDVITWHELRYHMSKAEAIRFLRGDQIPGVKSKRRPAPAPARPVFLSEPPPAEWQRVARAVVDFADEQLWETAPGERALEYLNARGITDYTIQAAQLGYIPARDDRERTYGRVLFDDWRKPDGKPVRVACGIVIPHFADGHLWALRVRRAVGDPKYMGVAGGSKALYWSDTIQPGLPVLVVEGEFDALIAWQCAADLVSPVAIASASNADVNPYWFPKLMSAPRILARFDDDAAGGKYLPRLAALSACVVPCQVPHGKDVNEFYVLSEYHRDPIRRWLMEVS